MALQFMHLEEMECLELERIQTLKQGIEEDGGFGF
jgi:hypothetical protein